MHLRLTLYIAGATTNRSVTVKRRLSELAELLAAPLEIDVVDVLDEPERAESAGVIATPTLVREAPGSTLRVIGDLTRLDGVIAGLGMDTMLRREARLA